MLRRLAQLCILALMAAALAWALLGVLGQSPSFTEAMKLFTEFGAWKLALIGSLVMGGGVLLIWRPLGAHRPTPTACWSHWRCRARPGCSAGSSSWRCRRCPSSARACTCKPPLGQRWRAGHGGRVWPGGRADRHRQHRAVPLPAPHHVGRRSTCLAKESCHERCCEIQPPRTATRRRT